MHCFKTYRQCTRPNRTKKTAAAHPPWTGMQRLANPPSVHRMLSKAGSLRFAYRAHPCCTWHRSLSARQTALRCQYFCTHSSWNASMSASTACCTSTATRLNMSASNLRGLLVAVPRCCEAFLHHLLFDGTRQGACGPQPHF